MTERFYCLKRFLCWFFGHDWRWQPTGRYCRRCGQWVRTVDDLYGDYKQ